MTEENEIKAALMLDMMTELFGCDPISVESSLVLIVMDFNIPCVGEYKVGYRINANQMFSILSTETGGGHNQYRRGTTDEVIFEIDAILKGMNTLIDLV